MTGTKSMDMHNFKRENESWATTVMAGILNSLRYSFHLWRQKFCISTITKTQWTKERRSKGNTGKEQCTLVDFRIQYFRHDRTGLILVVLTTQNMEKTYRWSTSENREWTASSSWTFTYQLTLYRPVFSVSHGTEEDLKTSSRRIMSITASSQKH